HVTGVQTCALPILIKPSTTGHPLYESVVEACRTVYDPEIPVNIFDLGLIYTIDISPENEVRIVMTLTAPGCPVAGEMPGWVADAVEPIDGVKRSEEHTSELQSRENLVCRLLLEKKKLE